MTRKRKSAVLLSLLSAGILAIAVLLASGQNAGVNYFKSSLEKVASEFPGWTLAAESIYGD